MPREKTKDELQREEEEYQEFLRREVGEDLHEFITIDGSAIDIHGNAPNHEGDGDGKKREKKKDKGKGKEKGRPKTKEKEKEKEDQEFLIRCASPETSLTSLRNRYCCPCSYILNRGWIDRSAKRLPTYTEVTSLQNRKKSKAKGPTNEGDVVAGSSGSSSESEADGGTNNVIEDEGEFDDVADVFESSYNFRFEEP